MRLYCEKTGIEYEDSMVNWKPIEDMSKYDGFAAWYETMLKSTKFGPPSKEVDPKVMAYLPV